MRYFACTLGTMMKKYLPVFYIVVLLAFLAFAAINRPEPEIVAELAPVADFGMTLPENYREEFELYLVVDRPDETVRHLYAAPWVVDALDAGENVPFGAQVIIETWDAETDIFGNLRRDNRGRLLAGEMQPNIHMMEKQDDWTIEELPSPVGVIDWNFGSFDAETMLPSTENRNDCMTCHDGGAFRRDFLFSRPLLQDYVEENDVQYLFCSLSGRSNCIR